MVSHKFLSDISACFTTSANPDINWFSVKVSKKLGSIITDLGLENNPIWFLRLLKSTANFPPIEASTIASKVVGI